MKKQSYIMAFLFILSITIFSCKKSPTVPKPEDCIIDDFESVTLASKVNYPNNPWVISSGDGHMTINSSGRSMGPTGYALGVTGTMSALTSDCSGWSSSIHINAATLNAGGSGINVSTGSGYSNFKFDMMVIPQPSDSNFGGEIVVDLYFLNHDLSRSTDAYTLIPSSKWGTWQTIVIPFGAITANYQNEILSDLGKIEIWVSYGSTCQQVGHNAVIPVFMDNVKFTD